MRSREYANLRDVGTSPIQLAALIHGDNNGTILTHYYGFQTVGVCGWGWHWMASDGMRLRTSRLVRDGAWAWESGPSLRSGVFDDPEGRMPPIVTVELNSPLPSVLSRAFVMRRRRRARSGQHVSATKLLCGRLRTSERRFL
jgi:hypothetical protein